MNSTVSEHDQGKNQFGSALKRTCPTFPNSIAITVALDKMALCVFVEGSWFNIVINQEICS